MDRESPRTTANNPGAMSVPPLADSLDEGLEKLFGFTEFRVGQREVMERILEGRDTLVVMPTGSGKSLCFQLPACVMEGITLVISPLIALMKDQVDALEDKGLPATFINSSLSWGEQKDRLLGLENGRYKLLYVAPERFKSESFLSSIARVEVGMLAIDEAHCISQWGHDFRPDYLELERVRETLGEPTTVALTATATRYVQADICEQLGVPDADVMVSGFERPNLFFEVFVARSKEDKRNRMLALLDYYRGESAVVYCATRKQVEEISRQLDQNGVSCGIYHGGMSDGDRELIQDAWMNGEVPVLVATNAFGMGVDKPDVRAIVHYNMPGSLEAYYQEAGRAGRDGEPSHCLLLFNYADKGIHEWFSEQSYPKRETIEKVWDYLTGLGRNTTHMLTAEQIAQSISRRKNRIHPMGVDATLRLLNRAVHIESGSRDGFPYVAVLDQSRARDLRIDWASLEQRRGVTEEQIGDVVSYASKHGCRQVQMIKYFGGSPSFGAQCNYCDSCCGPAAYVLENADTLTKKIKIRDDGDTLLKKLLSGVARARGRWGANKVAGMLRGSKSKKVKQANLHKLSTYGVLGYLKQPDIVHLLDILTRHRLIGRNEHGAISITQLGGDVMRDNEAMPEALQAELSSTIELSSYTRSSRSSSGSSIRSAVQQPSTSDTYAATLQMIKDGEDYKDIARARELTTDTVLRHLIVLAGRGEEFDLSAHLDGKILPAMRDVAEDWQVGDQLSPLKDKIPVKCSYDQLKLHLAQVLMEREAS